MRHSNYSHPLTKMFASGAKLLLGFFSALLFVGGNLLKGEYFDSFGGLMAKVQYGEMIADMRGKINGTVHSRNRAGSYMRNKVTPVNPNTTYQTSVRNNLTNVAQAWRGLTATQRNAWNAAVSNFKKTNIFGQLRTPSGINLYSRLNLNILNIGGTVITDPPVPASVTALLTLSVVADDSSNTVVITFTPAIPVGTSMIVEATEPLSPGITFVKSEYRKISVLENSDTSPADISADYIAKFGSSPVTGTKIFVRCTMVVGASGLSGIPLSTSTITVA